MLDQAAEKADYNVQAYDSNTLNLVNNIPIGQQPGDISNINCA